MLKIKSYSGGIRTQFRIPARKYRKNPSPSDSARPAVASPPESSPALQYLSRIFGGDPLKHSADGCHWLWNVGWGGKTLPLAVAQYCNFRCIESKGARVHCSCPCECGRPRLPSLPQRSYISLKVRGQRRGIKKIKHLPPPSLLPLLPRHLPSCAGVPVLVGAASLLRRDACYCEWR